MAAAKGAVSGRADVTAREASMLIAPPPPSGVFVTCAGSGYRFWVDAIVAPPRTSIDVNSTTIMVPRNTCKVFDDDSEIDSTRASPRVLARSVLDVYLTYM
eukprot:m.39627 g.39627  ORF g.39627 m.39627 type:complete len:101 (+) comp18249_c0_seq2:2106-2408(+)